MPVNVLDAINEMAEYFAKKMPKGTEAFSPSEKVSLYVEGLIFKEKTEGLDTKEKEELDTYMVLEQIMRTIKAKSKAPRPS